MAAPKNPSSGPAHYRAVAVKVRDMEFATETECARHFGLTRQAVSLAKQNGSLDSLGLGLERKPSHSVACRVGRRKFVSESAASRATGIPISTLSQALRRGKKVCRGFPVEVLR